MKATGETSVVLIEIRIKQGGNMEYIVDARGLDCPKPVIALKKAVEEGNAKVFKVMVDNPVASSNIQKFASSIGAKSEVLETEGEFHILVDVSETEKHKDDKNLDTLYLVATDILGSDEELGKSLMETFLFTMSSSADLPKTMVFLNAGVKLTTSGLESLKVIAEKGVRILSCGACLNYFGLQDKLAVGEVSNMYEIYTMISSHGKVVRL